MLGGFRQMEFFDWLFWGPLYFAAVLSAGHALLYKRDPRSALGWIVVCLAFPRSRLLLLLAPRRQSYPYPGTRLAGKWQGHRMDPLPFRMRSQIARPDSLLSGFQPLSPAQSFRCHHPPAAGERQPSGTFFSLHPKPFQPCSRPLKGAQKSVFLSTYIFGTDAIGRQFIDELKKAAGARRGRSNPGGCLGRNIIPCRPQNAFFAAAK